MLCHAAGGRDDVGDAVAVEVRHRQRVGIRADLVVPRGLEGAVAVAQENAHVVGDRVDADDVGDAVAVEVRHRDVVGARSGGVGHLGSEGAVAGAQAHSHVPGHVVGIDQVGDAVAGEVGHRHAGGPGETWALIGGVDCRRLERAIAVAQQHPDRVVGVVGEDQVGYTVPVDVRHRQVARAGAGGDYDLRLKRAVAIVQQYADRVGALVDGQDVQPTVVGHLRQLDNPHAVSDAIGLGRLETCHHRCPERR